MDEFKTCVAKMLAGEFPADAEWETDWMVASAKDVDDFVAQVAKPRLTEKIVDVCSGSRMDEVAVALHTVLLNVIMKSESCTTEQAVDHIINWLNSLKQQL